MKEQWTTEQEQYLTDYYNGGKGVSVCVVGTGKPRHAVKQKAKRLGLTGVRRSFTEAELAFIKENYSDYGQIRIAKILGVKACSVNTLVSKLKLRVKPEIRSSIQSEANRGRVLTAETKKKIADAHRVYLTDNFCSDCGKQIDKRSTRCRNCNLKTRRGENHNFWKGGVTDLYQVVQNQLWSVWKIKILSRDGFKCQECGEHQHLEVHHLRPFIQIREGVLREHPDLSLSDVTEVRILADLIIKEHQMEDGITLCYLCHKSRHFEKRDELLGGPTATGEDNQQPSQSNVKSIVDWKVQRLTLEDSRSNKSDTSVPLSASLAV